jgi:hypothetical protein
LMGSHWRSHLDQAERLALEKLEARAEALDAERREVTNALRLLSARGRRRKFLDEKGGV